MSYFTFNGISKDYLKMLTGAERPAFAPINRTFVELDTMPGAYLSSTKKDVREMTIPVLFEHDGYTNLHEIEEDLAAWLITSEPKELVFYDEPDRIYKAVVSDSLDIEKLVHLGHGEITFVCPNPHKFGAEVERTVTNGGSFTVNGSVNTEPVISMDMTAESTFATVIRADGTYNMIGIQADADDAVFEKKTVILNDDCSTVSNWTTATTSDVGTVTGTMGSNNYQFSASDYGTATGWHGPAIVRSLSASATDFEASAYITFNSNKSEQLGRIVVSLLDEQGTPIVLMEMWKRYSGLQPYFRVRVNPSSSTSSELIAYTTASTATGWLSFSGVIRVSRIGNEWACYAARIGTNGVHDARFYTTWVDVNSIATTDIRQIKVQIAQNGTTATPTQAITHLSVNKINRDPEGIPVILYAGDAVEFDHVNDIIRINGEERNDLKAFTGSYFSLPPGENTITAEPSGSVSNVKVKWQPKWH